MKYWVKDKIFQIKHWWNWRWFRRNQIRLRNVAAWALNHHAGGGSYDQTSILAGHADRRISEAADGRINK